MRVKQPPGERGSLKWIQRAVQERWPSLEVPIRSRIGCEELQWVSPLKDDHYAEYRDSAFLSTLGIDHLAPALGSFWPKRGPQWDALARFGTDGVLLVEAKSHIPEFCTPPTGAGDESRALIEKSLDDVAGALGVIDPSAWRKSFYQFANRIAHLWFLRNQGVNAWLVMVGFLGDREMGGPETVEVWDAAYRIALYVLGLPQRHPLAPYMIYVSPRVPDE